MTIGPNAGTSGDTDIFLCRSYSGFISRKRQSPEAGAEIDDLPGTAQGLRPGEAIENHRQLGVVGDVP